MGDIHPTFTSQSPTMNVHMVKHHDPWRLKQQNHTYFLGTTGEMCSKSSQIRKTLTFLQIIYILQNWNQAFQQNKPRQNSAAMSIANPAFLHQKNGPTKKIRQPRSSIHQWRRPPCKAASAFKTTLCWPLEKRQGDGGVAVRKMRDAFHSSLEYVEGVHNSSRYC